MVVNYLKFYSIKNNFLNLFLMRDYLLILIFIILFSNFSKGESYQQSFLKNFNSEISLLIIGKNKREILGNSFTIKPSNVLVNGVSKNITCFQTCEMDDDLNNVTLIFNEQIDTCAHMFESLVNLKEIDLSKFDASNVNSMFAMFNGCTNLEEINFGNINTSLVTNMKELFQDCKKLISIDVSKFDTSNVETMYRMFGFCESIKYLDVSNFNTKKVLDMFDIFAYCYKLVALNASGFDTSKTKNMRGMFYHCYDLKYLDISNFDSSSATTLECLFTDCTSLIYINCKPLKSQKDTALSSPFNELDSNLKLCIDDTTTKTKIFGSKYALNCNNVCFNENIKVDIELNKCVEECDENKFEYNKICNSTCLSGYPILLNNRKTCREIIPNNFYFDSSDKIYKECYKSCENCYDSGNYIIHNCIKCKEDYKFINDSFIREKNNCYEKCDYYYYLKEMNETQYYYCTHNDSCPEEYSKLIIQKNKCVNKCKNDDLYIYEYNNICYEKCPNGTIINEIAKICFNSTDNEKGKMISSFQEQIQNGDIDSLLKNISETKDDYFQREEDIILQITTSENQKNNTKGNISSIDLGDCEDRLKEIYEINDTLPLIIFKLDYYSPDSLIPIIAYEIYHPLNKSKLDLKYCEDILIKLNIPVSIDENNLFKYDPNSVYYTDSCYSYTTENGTDIILKDRQKEFSDNNLSLCEKNCNYTGYSSESKQSYCDCNAKNEIDVFSNIIDNSEKLNNDFSSSGSSNIITIKCTKTLFTKKGLLHNIASYIMLFIIAFFIISIFLFMRCGYPLLKDQINRIIYNKKDNINKNKMQNNDKNKLVNNINKKKLNITKNRKNIIMSTTNSKNKITSSKKKDTKKTKNITNSLNMKKTNKPKKTFKDIIASKNNKNTEKYNDFELNMLNYKTALLYDKRTCLEYYICLLKSKIPILFGFCPKNDYNSLNIKLCIFWLSFAIYYALNFSFFNEKIIHKIFEDGGKYDIMYFLPKISLSFAISHIITIIIKLIFLSERNLMNIRIQTSLESSERISSKERKNIFCKYIIFFILSLLFLVFFWFLLSSFGAVYKNTQIFIFKNALISFAMSFVYEFFINIFPCIFRIASLRTETRNKECSFTFSKFLQIL